jgi:CTP synthase
MRLGAYPCALKPGSRALEIYKKDEISERHRHRFEVNNEFREGLTGHGLVLSGTSPDNRLVEIVELPNHPHFLGCQFHPEFKSRPMAAHPLFSSFVAAAVVRRDTLAKSAQREGTATEPSSSTVN